MAAAHLSYRPLLRGTRVGVAYGAAFLALGACALLARVGKANAAEEVAFGLAVACLLYANTVAPYSRFDRALSWGPLVTLGGFSYSLYLMHHPIQQVIYAVKPAWVRGEGPVLAYLLVVGLPIILLGTRLFALVFERPFLASGIPSRAPRATDPWVPTSLPLKTTSGKAAAPEKKAHGTGLRAQGVYAPSLSPQP
jgi:peptidoglycan/LPS O-acetylase OafA/YrhL